MKFVIPFLTFVVLLSSTALAQVDEGTIVAQCATEIASPDVATVFGYKLTVEPNKLTVQGLSLRAFIEAKESALAEIPMIEIPWTLITDAAVSHSCTSVVGEGVTAVTTTITVYQDYVTVLRSSPVAHFAPLAYRVVKDQDKPLMSCYEQSTDGPADEAPFRLLSVFATDAGQTLATLSSESLGGSQVVSEMICGHSDSSVLPGGVTRCNNPEWDDRWNAEFLTAREPGGDPATVIAILLHNEVEVARLGCVASQPQAQEVFVEGGAASK